MAVVPSGFSPPSYPEDSLGLGSSSADSNQPTPLKRLETEAEFAKSRAGGGDAPSGLAPAAPAVPMTAGAAGPNDVLFFVSTPPSEHGSVKPTKSQSPELDVQALKQQLLRVLRNVRVDGGGARGSLL